MKSITGASLRPITGQQILCKLPLFPQGFIGALLTFPGLKNRNSAKVCTISRNSGVCSRSFRFSRYTNLLGELMRRALAPLRRIVSRELEVFQSGKTGFPRSFAITDQMECGHSHVDLTWDGFDLLNAYSSAPQVRARFHRCQECASLVATKKPPMSVTAEPQRKTA